MIARHRPTFHTRNTFIAASPRCAPRARGRWRLDSPLLVARELGEPVGEGIWDSQVHAHQPICCTKAPCAACGTGVTDEIAAWRSTTETEGSSPATAPS